MKTLAAAVFLLFSISAIAVMPNPLPWDTDYNAWTAPTTCQDGSPLSNCPIRGYEIQTAPVPAGPFVTIGTTGPTVLEHIRPNVSPGQNCYRVLTKGDAGLSAPSNVSCVTSVKPPTVPGPPILRTVDTVAYKENNGNANKVSYNAIGTVPLGTACLNYSSNQYRLVDRKKVKLNAGMTSLPLQVWARCG